MKFLKFMFTARMSFILFAFLAFAFTMLYLTWNNRHAAPVSPQQPRAAQVR